MNKIYYFYIQISTPFVIYFARVYLIIHFAIILQLVLDCFWNGFGLVLVTIIHCKPSVICIFQEQFLAFIFANLKAKKYEIGNQDA